MTHFIKNLKRKKVFLHILYSALLCGVFLFCGINLAYAFLGVLLAFYITKYRKIDVNLTDIVLLFVLFLFTSFLIGQPLHFVPYASTLIAFSILITLLYNNLELSGLLIMYCSLITGVILGNELSTVVYYFCAGMVATFICYRTRRRWQIIEAGLSGGIVALLLYMLLKQERVSIDTAIHFLMNGFLSPIIVLGMLPIFEFLFKVVTNISLLELTDFNHPLLKKMILEAPGTYQHSLVVANLAEAAAEAIGANSLLTRVGAYYHDIGKISKSEYFTENQVPYKDMHKNLTPAMSTLVILNHVKEGLELAFEHKISPKVVDFIAQHHGTTLVYYFYQRAKHMEGVENEEQFRYPGPKPQNKETAIVHLADAVEAISRSLEDPSPSRIREMVNDTIKKKFLEGQLDETDLTLKDLDAITDSFSRILCAVFHTRIDYPKDES